MISWKFLREMLTYHPDTGKWTRNKTCGRHDRHKAGSDVGHINKVGKLKGYLTIRFNGKAYLGHRLAWFYMTGSWPEFQIDHINGIPGDDRWENLRQATHAENARNSRMKSGNKSGLKGVSYQVSKFGLQKPFRARIVVNRKNIYLGLFATATEAHDAYCKAAEKYHKNFARTK